MNSIERQRKHFDSIADRYFSARQTKNHLYFKKLLWKYFLKDLKWSRKSTLVLEPMCGYSEGKKILSENLKSRIIYEGFDYSQPLIDKAKKSRPNLNVYKQDVTKFKPSKKYDIVIVTSGLHHVYKYTNKVLRTLSNSLKEDGYLISLEPTHNNVLFGLIRHWIYKMNEVFDSETEKDYDLKVLNRHFKTGGYKIVKQIYPGLLDYVLYYNPDSLPILNKGSRKVVDYIFNLEKPLYTNFIGEFFSFATLTLLKKKESKI